MSLRIWLFQVPLISGIVQYLSFCDWLISSSIISSRFIQVLACVRISILLKAFLLYAYSTLCLSIHPSMDALSCFQLFSDCEYCCCEYWCTDIAHSFLNAHFLKYDRHCPGDWNMSNTPSVSWGAFLKTFCPVLIVISLLPIFMKREVINCDSTSM